MSLIYGFFVSILKFLLYVELFTVFFGILLGIKNWVNWINTNDSKNSDYLNRFWILIKYIFVSSVTSFMFVNIICLSYLFFNINELFKYELFRYG